MWRFKNIFKSLLSSLVIATSVLNIADMYRISAHSSCEFSTGCICGGTDVSVTKWNQGNYGDACNANWSDFIQTGGDSIESSGCYSTSLAMEMKMSGDFGEKFCPTTLFNWGASNGLWSGGGLNPLAVESIPQYSGIWKAYGVGVDDLVGDAYTEDFSVKGTHETVYKAAVKLAKAGAYVIIKLDPASGYDMHFIAVVGVVPADNEAGGELLVADPGSTNGDENGERIVFHESKVSAEDAEKYPQGEKGGVLWNESAINYINVFASASKFTGKVNSPNTASLKDKQASAQENFIEFGTLLSQETYVSVSKLEEGALDLPTLADLRLNYSFEQAMDVRGWADDIATRKETRVMEYLRIIFMFLGILITVYAVALFIAFQFDRINNFVDISLLSILTLHRLQISPDEAVSTYSDTNSEKTKMVNLKAIILITLIGVTIGVLCITGYVFRVVSWVVALVDKIF